MADDGTYAAWLRAYAPESNVFGVATKTMDLRDFNRTFSASALAVEIDKAAIVFVGLGDGPNRCVKGGSDEDVVCLIQSTIDDGAGPLCVLGVVVANELHAEHIEEAATWIADGMCGEEQIRDWGNMIVAAFGRGELH